MAKKFKREKISMNINFCVINKRLNTRNLPTKPSRGGIPAIDRNKRTIVKDKKLFLLRVLRLFNVFIFLISKINNKLKNRNNIYMYMYIFI